MKDQDELARALSATLANMIGGGERSVGGCVVVIAAQVDAAGVLMAATSVSEGVFYESENQVGMLIHSDIRKGMELARKARRDRRGEVEDQ